jgi:hypothetical protein
MFPDRDYRMVHNSRQGAIRQIATIYGGKNKFLKFSSVYPMSDLREHVVNIHSANGEFACYWGDGDYLRSVYPETLPEHGPVGDYIRMSKRDRRHWSNNDNEVTFLMEVATIVHYLDDSWWLNKEKWTQIKASI